MSVSDGGRSLMVGPSRMGGTLHLLIRILGQNIPDNENRQPLASADLWIDVGGEVATGTIARLISRAKVAAAL